jgi:hypothetical protein
METLSQTPPELAADIYNTGIYPVVVLCCEDWTKEFLKKTDLFTLQKILYER